MDLPRTLLLHIFSYIPIHERWPLASVCRSWYHVCYDPYLYRHIEFNGLEYKVLVASLQRISKIAPRIQSIHIKDCYSEFVQNTVVPVHFSNRAQTTTTTRPMLFSHITALQPARRRDEYLKHQFTLHNQFSDAMNALLQSTSDCLVSLSIEGCTLDLEMTELFCALIAHSHALQSFVYTQNHDKGIPSSGLLQAIVISCTRMRHFIGLHSGMDDAVLYTMARHWKQLESLTLGSLKHPQGMSEDPFTRASPAGRISAAAFWQLLSDCRRLRNLELHDLACISNRDLKTQRFQPYAIPSKSSGASVRHLTVTKYMTTPLSKPGFESLLRMFPNLNHLTYETNFHTFDNLFEGITRDMFEAECKAVQDWFNKIPRLTYIGRWHNPITAEQRLMAGMASVSEA